MILSTDMKIGLLYASLICYSIYVNNDLRCKKNLKFNNNLQWLNILKIE